MRRLTVLTIGVLAFAFLLCSTADAGFRHRVRERRVSVTKKVEVKKEVKAVRLIPSRCQGGTCNAK